jgi:hypothetical protein
MEAKRKRGDTQARAGPRYERWKGRFKYLILFFHFFLYEIMKKKLLCSLTGRENERHGRW